VFENVPERLSDYIKQASPTIWHGDREILYLLAASGVIGEYLRKNFFEPTNDPFIPQTRINEAGDFWFGYSTRILIIGQTLFAMRSSAGFAEFCSRLKSRDLRATFYEMLAAKMFLRNGFEVHAKPETMIRGQDFDFSAVRGSDEINVEVTALTAPSFSLKTILNALNHKRKQLAGDKPAVIFCAIPDSWGSSGANLDFSLFYAACKFFATTRRITAIVFSMERHTAIKPDGSAGIFNIINKTFSNDRARIKLNDMNFLFTGISVSDTAMRGFMRPSSLSDNQAAVDQIVQDVSNTEFHRWVDSLVPRTS
jgi:hypothetical protein